jgi:catechol 2,3-dioxygenase-like lactoylglutathione lyase family enzyme/uncharacterized protein YciI
MDALEARVAENRWHWLMLMKVGPSRDQDDATAERIQRDHLRHLFELEAAGMLTLFGPVDEAGDLRGIGVLTVPTREEAEALMAEDPAVVAGRLRVEVRPWFTRPGATLPAVERPQSTVRQLRVVVTAEDYDDALAFYRDGLGLREEAAFAVEGGHVTILDAGRATLELTDPIHAAYIDRVEVGRRVAGQLRVAFEVADAAAASDALVEAGATLVAPPTRTPWDSLNARLDGPAGLHLTLFEELSRSSERT